MTAFIEVKRHNGGKAVLVNTAAIERIHDTGSWRRITFIGGTAAGEAETLDVADSYDELKGMIGKFHQVRPPGS